MKNAIKAMEASMTKEELNRAHAQAESEIFAIKLSELRDRQGIRQSDVGAFSQASVSKLERRNDMKLSTLIEYLSSIGMGLEILVFPKDSTDRRKAETLLKA